MRHSEVLVITQNTKTPRILNWKVSTVNNVETAIEKLQQRPYKVVAISSEISETDQLKLSRLITILFDEIILVTYSDVSTLSEKVSRSYWSKKTPNATSNYLDNSFEMKLASSIRSN